MTLERVVISTTLHLATPFALYTELAHTYQDLNYGSAVELQSKLFTTFYKPHQQMFEHIKNLRLIQNETIAAGFPCTDSTFAAAVLVTVMKHGYSSFRSILDDFRGRSTLKPFPSSELINALESSQRLMTASSSSIRYIAPNSSRGTQDEPRSSSGSDDRSATFLCNYCHSPGHIARNCRKLAAAHPQQQQRQYDARPSFKNNSHSKAHSHSSQGKARVMAASSSIDTESWHTVPSGAAQQGKSYRAATANLLQRSYAQVLVAGIKKRKSRATLDSLDQVSFLADSGAEISVINDLKLLHNASFSDNILVMPAVGPPVLTTARGDIKIKLTTTTGATWNLILQHV